MSDGADGGDAEAVPADEAGVTEGSASVDADGVPEADAMDGSRLRRFLNYGLLAGLLLLALVAAVGFYTAVSSAISIWVADEWQPLFRAGFNLAVLLLAGSGIAWQVRRLA